MVFGLKRWMRGQAGLAEAERALATAGWRSLDVADAAEPAVRPDVVDLMTLRVQSQGPHILQRVGIAIAGTHRIFA